MDKFVTGCIIPPRWKAMHPDQVGRLVAYLLGRVEKVTSIEVTREALRVTVRGDHFPEDIEVQVKALALAPLYVCPCGCGADMLLGNCYRDDRRAGMAIELTQTERDEVGAGNWIGAITAVRVRLGLGLKEAKEAVDAYREGVDRMRQTYYGG